MGKLLTEGGVNKNSTGKQSSIFAASLSPANNYYQITHSGATSVCNFIALFTVFFSFHICPDDGFVNQNPLTNYIFSFFMSIC